MGALEPLSDKGDLHASRRARSDRTGLHAKLKLTFAALALLASGFAAARQVRVWPARLRYPGELSTVEGRELADMVLLRKGGPVYAAATPERYNSAEYGPFYYLLGSRLIDPQQPAYRPLRMLSTLGALGLAAGCGLLAFWLARSFLAAAIAPLIFLAYRFTTVFGVIVHSDTFALLLWFGGFLVAFRFRDSRKILWAVPLMTLGLFYKGQFVAAFLAVLLFLLLEKRFRLAATFAGLLASAAVSLFLAFQFLIFRGQAFWLHTLAYNVIPFSLDRGLFWASVFGLLYAVPTVVAGLYLRAYPNKLVACYLGWAMVLPLLTIGKRGSSVNYSFESVLVLSPLLAAWLARSIASPSRAVVSLFILGITLWAAQFPKFTLEPWPVDFAEDQAVQSYLRDKFPPHAPGLGTFTGDLLRAGLDTPIANLYQYTWLVCKGALPEEGLLRQIRNRRFRLILLNQDFSTGTDLYKHDYMCVTESLRQAVIQNYRLDATFAFHLAKTHYYVWVPQ